MIVAVLPAALTLLWSGQNHVAVIASPILGLACSLIAWLVTAKNQYGPLTVDTTGSNNPMLAGNVVALLSPCVFVPVLTLAFGSQKYDWQSMKQIKLGDDSDAAAAAHVDPEQIPTARHGSASADQTAKEQKQLDRAAKIARALTVFLTVALLVLWPMPMFGSGYVFSKPFFTGWVSVGILWLFCSTACVGVWPLIEGRHSMARTFRGIVRDLSGKGRRTVFVGHDGQESMGSGDQDTARGEEKMQEKI